MASSQHPRRPPAPFLRPLTSLGGWRTPRFSGAPFALRMDLRRCAFSRISSSSRKQLWVGHVFFRLGTSGLQELVEAEEFGGGPHLNSEKRLLGAPQFAIRVLHPP